MNSESDERESEVEVGGEDEADEVATAGDDGELASTGDQSMVASTGNVAEEGLDDSIAPADEDRSEASGVLEHDVDEDDVGEGPTTLELEGEEEEETAMAESPIGTSSAGGGGGTTSTVADRKPAKGGRKQKKAAPPNPRKGRAPAVKGLTIPFRTVKKAMKLDSELTLIVQNEAAIMTTLAAELFLKNLAKESHRIAKNRGRNTIRYEDIAEARTNDGALSFLETLLP